MKLSHKKRTIVPILLGTVTVAVAVLVLSIFFQLRNESIPGAGDAAHGGVILSNGEDQCRMRPYLHTVLLTGTDTLSEVDPARDTDPLYPIAAPFNNTQVDFIMLLVFDLKARTVTPIQLNRDTMCDVPYLSLNGKVLGTRCQQLSLSHNAGSGGEDSCRYVAGVVSDLLMGVPVDHFLSLSMDGVPVINDLVGGVTVTMTEDYVADDGARLFKGEQIFLNGSDALRFVRTRRHDSVDDNVGRMGRHRMYLEAFARQARLATEKDPDLILRSFDQIAPYMFTDLDLNSYADLLNRLSAFELLPVRTPDGEYRMGEKWAEFYPDEEGTWALIKELFT